MDAVTQRFGQRVKALRAARGWTQEQLGRASGLDPKHIGVIERGKKSSSFDAVEKLAAALRVDPHELFLPEDRPAIRPIAAPPANDAQDFAGVSKLEMVAFLRDLDRRIKRLGKTR